mmetsp:Transcript_23654/g.61701  ORF Transcript_23654/g.61701 Transcript_23654/m.61701 type:complete len:215 (+) Transcript_23654:448-1092(+)
MRAHTEKSSTSAGWKSARGSAATGPAGLESSARPLSKSAWLGLADEKHLHSEHAATSCGTPRSPASHTATSLVPPGSGPSWGSAPDPARRPWVRASDVPTCSRAMSWAFLATSASARSAPCRQEPSLAMSSRSWMSWYVCFVMSLPSLSSVALVLSRSFLTSCFTKPALRLALWSLWKLETVSCHIFARRASSSACLADASALVAAWLTTSPVS